MPFNGETPISVFYLLKQACIEMARISHMTCCKDKPLSTYVYPRFVYNRFMWGEYVTILSTPFSLHLFSLPSSPPLLSEASLYLRVCADFSVMTQNTSNLWQDMLIKFSPNLVMDLETMAEVKEGLEFGWWMQLPSNLTFSTLHLAKLFASEGHVRPFSHLR